MAMQFLQQFALDEFTGILYDAVAEKALLNGLSTSQISAVQTLVAGSKVQDTVSRNIVAEDNGRLLAPIGPLTYVIPAGLSPAPSFTLDCPATGVITIAAGTGVLINGASISLSRSRSSNFVGFVIVAHNEVDSYGVSGI